VVSVTVHVPVVPEWKEPARAPPTSVELLHPLAVKVVPPANMLAFESAGAFFNVGALDIAVAPGLNAAQARADEVDPLKVKFGVIAPAEPCTPYCVATLSNTADPKLKPAPAIRPSPPELVMPVHII
jgi:hypothetical protein